MAPMTLLRYTTQFMRSLKIDLSSNPQVKSVLRDFGLLRGASRPRGKKAAASSEKKKGHSQVLPIPASVPRSPRRPAEVEPTRPEYEEEPRRHDLQEEAYGRSLHQHHEQDRDWEGPKPYSAPRHESAHPQSLYSMVNQPAGDRLNTGSYPREPRLVQPLIPVRQPELMHETKRQQLPVRSPLARVTPNRHFDGRTVDPKTGRMYEYNTTTGERRWLSKEEQKNIEKRALNPPGYVP